ncbi:MAG: sugar phosphate isomerase/epimerase [Candidatus Sumerlaeota bacterium]|nr:sugar phosphate isomerase/epimerase [Candidatus Sumerlaeota bacterium]
MSGRYKFGAHIFLWTDRWSGDSLNLLERAKLLGLEALEIAIGDDVEFSAPLLRRHAESLSMEIVMSPGGVWPMECDISSDDADCRARGLAWHRRMIDLAALSGAAAYCGAIYGHPGRVLRRRPPADEMPRIAENLRRLAEYAARAGVRIAIEPMSHFRTHLITTPRQAIDLLRLVDHPNLSILLDTYHVVTEIRDFPEAIREIGSLLWGMHACENDRGVPGSGLIPWDGIFAALRQTRPDARIIFETYNTSLGDFAYTRGIFQDICPNGDEFARQGMKFFSRVLQGGET